MSTEAFVGVGAVPVTTVAGVAAAGIVAAAGAVIIVGGVVLVGTAGACVAAGSAVAKRVRARADLCKSEYERYMALRATAFQDSGTPVPAPTTRLVVVPGIAQPRAQAPRFVPSPISRYHDDRAIATALTDRLTTALDQSTGRLEHGSERAATAAYLHALIELDAQLPQDLQARATRALNSNDAAAMQGAITAIKDHQGKVRSGELQRLQAGVNDLVAQIDAVLALAPRSAEAADTRLVDELTVLRRQVVPLRTSRDQRLLGRQLNDGAVALTSLQGRAARRRTELRTALLAELWGTAQAVGGLVADLELLHGIGQVTDVAILKQQVVTVVEQVQQLESTDETPDQIRPKVARLITELGQIESVAVKALHQFNRNRLVELATTAIVDLSTGLDPYFTEHEVQQIGDQIVVRGRNGNESLTLMIRHDGTVKYDASGYGDERCIGAVEALLGKLKALGVILDDHEPELRKQARVATEVMAALEAMGYAGQIAVSERDGIITVEAANGFVSRIDRQGGRADQTSPVGSAAPVVAPDTTAAKVQDVVTQRVAGQRNRARKRMSQGT